MRNLARVFVIALLGSLIVFPAAGCAHKKLKTVDEKEEVRQEELPGEEWKQATDREGYVVDEEK